MTEPGIGEVGRSVGMAALAGQEQILLERKALGGVVHVLDVVHTMTVVTHRLVGGSLGVSLLEQGDRGAVKIGHVSIQHVGRDAIFVHDLGIRMTFAADLGGRIDAEAGRIGALDGVHAVAIGASRDVGILIVDNAAAMDAVKVLGINVIVAAGANFGDGSVLAGGGVAGGILLDRRLGVRVVAVRADWGIAVALVE